MGIQTDAYVNSTSDLRVSFLIYQDSAFYYGFVHARAHPIPLPVAFAHCKIEVPLVGMRSQPFSHPLALRIFCSYIRQPHSDNANDWQAPDTTPGVVPCTFR